MTFDYKDCRFLQTVMSADTKDVELTQLMADYRDFYSSLSSLLGGDWQMAGREISSVLLLLNICREGKKRPAA